MIATGTLILVSLIVVPLFVSYFILVIIFRQSRRGRRSPLTGNLLRSPGETLRAEIEKISEKVDGFIFILLGTCAPPLIILMALSALQSNRLLIWQLILSILLYMALLTFAMLRLYKLLNQRANFVLGLDAELAVGQELNHLMVLGCRVFHDFPAENFNIDHVVIGPTGVIAVETKGRAKPDKGRGSADATVIYDGQILHFPDWHEKKPLDQAKRQADWLQKWLSSAVGEPVQVKPALALPGWFVERTKPGNVLVFNGKSPQFLVKQQIPNTTLNPGLIQRVAHQIEQRCRDVEPVAYRKAK